jgi:hypothetical protein
MAQAICHATTVQSIYLNEELKRRALPFSRVRWYDIEVRANKRDGFFRTTRIRKNHIPPIFRIANMIDLKIASLHEGSKFFTDDIASQIFLRGRSLFEGRILEMFAMRYHTA